MAKKLACSVTLRKSEIDLPVSFLPGETLPDWALELVGDHVFDLDEIDEDPRFEELTTPAPADKDEDDPDNVEVEVILNHDEDHRAEDDEGPQDDDIVIPSRAASKVIWAKFAQEAVEAGMPLTIDGTEDREKIITKLEEAGVIPVKG